jgi:hypothetical protein
VVDGLDAGTAEHVVAQVGRVLDAHVLQVNRKMATFSAVAERFADIHKKDAEEADALMAKADAYEKRRPEVTARGHKYFDDKTAELESMDADLTRLSNAIPTDGGTPGGGSPGS